MSDCFRLLLLVCVCQSSIANTGADRLLSAGWEFHQGDLGGPWEALRTLPEEVLVWTPVTVPHCYNAFDAVNPDRPYYQGPGWYRKTVDCRRSRSSDRVLVRFGAAGQAAKVYVGATLVAEHLGGYDAFVVDITDALEPYAKTLEAVPLLVRCDNSRNLEQPPSDLSDFTLYGGLFRPVELQVVPEVSLQRVDVIPTVESDGSGAIVRLDVLLRNPTTVSGTAEVAVHLTTPDGVAAASRTVDAEDVRSGGKLSLEIPLQQIQFWSPRQPDLYGYTVEIKRDNQSHRIVGRFGFRTFRFEKHGPFYLNGERLLLRGMHRHEDHAGYGAAVPASVVRDELRLMKQMGANFIRLGHYQQSDLVLDLCDELGLLVWEEIPWCRGGLGGTDYRQSARRMLAAMINQHRNHPSVILWGLGNENDWPGDFAVFDKDAIREFMKELHSLAKDRDPSRLTSIRRCDFCKDIVDVYSPSIWAGWYRGRYTDYRSVTENERDRVDRFFHAEWGASHHAGRHSESPDQGIEEVQSGLADERGGDFLSQGGATRVSKDGDWSETYACNLIDWHLKEQETMPWLTGSAYWSFKDFATPLRPENPIPYVNQKGVVQRDLKPKESYYVFQSYWSKVPMLRLYGKTWPIRWGDAEETKLIKVYSNCEEVELFVNGESCGTRRRDSQDFPAAGLRWRVQLTEGENHVKAIATQGDDTLVDEMDVQYQTTPWGPTSRILVEVFNKSEDVATVKVVAVDKSHTPCLDAKRKVRFSIAGDASLIADLGVVGGSRLIELANGVAEISILKGAGESVVGVSSKGLESQFIAVGPCSPVDSPRVAEQDLE